MKIQRRHFAETLVLTALSALTGCGGSAPEQPAKKSRWIVGMSQCNLGEPWRVQMNADLRAAAARHPEMEVIFKDAQNDTLKQRSHIEEFIAAKVDLLLVSPNEANPLAEPVAKAYAAGIPVIVLDRALPGDRFTTFIGADNPQIGRAAGEWILAKTGGHGRVVELKGLMTSIPAQDRNAGFRAAIRGSALDVLFEADMKWLEPQARKEMESALARFPAIDVVYAHNDPGAHGAWLAARAAGREKQMRFVSIDALPQEGQAYVRDGILDATFLYPTGGQEAIDTASRILLKQAVPKRITLSSRIFTKENIERGGDPIGAQK